MIAEVIVDVLNSEVDKVFEYIIPDDLCVEIGHRLLVPFGNRSIEGYLLSIKEKSSFDSSKLKQIISVLDEKPLINNELMQLIRFMKEKYYLRYVDCFRLIIPSEIRNGKVRSLVKKTLRLADENVVNNYILKLRANSKNPQFIINYLRENGVGDYTQLASKYSNSTVNKMIEQGVLIIDEVKVNRAPTNTLEVVNKSITLTSEQQYAVDSICDKPDLYLLYGVTGSGKTEVYMNVINKVLNEGKTAIMLVPEISLTPQVVGLFTARFGNDIAVIHSGLSAGEKFDEWKRIYEGDAKIVVGARSAIFSPLKNLGVIIIDEEHDSSYVSDSNPRYFTSDVAQFRAKYNNCSLVLGSATPNIESFYKAKTGEYKLLELTKRVNNRDMPPINIVDMCSEFRMGNKTPFSAVLIDKLKEVVSNNNQAILFINRRGFSSFLMCRDCGYIPKCEDCDVSLVYHKFDNEMKCHYCGKRYRVLTRCPNCGSENIKLGGVGTERVVSELKEIFPDVPIFRMDNDTTKTKNSHSKILNEFSKSKPAILVGTQMVAKGHDFPNVSLVGILEADLSLFFNDYKASERTFQLITQVSGRAGRSDVEGSVILQTYFPKNYVYNLVSSYNYKKFYEKEINLRKVTKFPPFSKIIRILITSENDDLAKGKTHEIFLKLKDLRIKNKEKFIFLEAMRSPVGRIKTKFRYQIVTRIVDSNSLLEKNINEIVGENKKNVSIFIEQNPQSLS